MRPFAVVCLAVALVVVGGCHKSSVSVVDEMIAVQNAWCDALESGSETKFAELKARIETFVKNAKDVNPDELQKMMEKRKDDVAKVQARLRAIMMKNPQAMQKSMGLMQELMKGMKMPGAPGQ